MVDANALDDENTAKAEVAELLQAYTSATNTTAEELAERIAAIYEPVFVDQYAEGHKDASEALEEEEENVVEEAYTLIKSATPTNVENVREGELYIVTLTGLQLYTLQGALERYSDIGDSEYLIQTAIANDLYGYLPRTDITWQDVRFDGTYEEADELNAKLYPR